MCFSCFCHSKYHKSIMPPLQWDFFFNDVYFFLWTAIFCIYLLPADIWEEWSPHRKFDTLQATLPLIKFYLIKNMSGNRGNYLAKFKFPLLGILWDVFYHMVKFTVSLISLPSVHLFVCFPNNLRYCCQQMRGAYIRKCVQLITL